MQVSLTKTFAVCILLILPVIAGLQIIGIQLITEEVPGGIIDYEFAGSLKESNRIHKSWGEEGMLNAAISLGLDYLFLVLYALALSLASIIVSKGLTGSLFGSVGKLMVILACVAGLLDAIENFALIRILRGYGTDELAILAEWCAKPKFALVALVLVYIIFGYLISLKGRKKVR